jgi:hypothetical protein
MTSSLEYSVSAKKSEGKEIHHCHPEWNEMEGMETGMGECQVRSVSYRSVKK